MKLMLTEDGFGGNDIYIILFIILSYSAYFLLPRLFSKNIDIFLLFLFGIVNATLLDNTIGAHIYDYYDIMDGKHYTLMDVLVYFLYGPFAYFFIYFYKKLKIHSFYTVLYVLLWTSLSLGVDWVNVKMGVFTFKNGYGDFFSIPIYLSSQTILLLFYHYIIKRQKPR